MKKLQVWLADNQLWTGIAFVLVGILLRIAGWDRIEVPAIGAVNVDVMFISVGAVFAVIGLLRKKQ